MYSLELGVFIYKYSINDLPNAFNDYFTKRSDIHGYKTRHVNDLTLTTTTTTTTTTKQDKTKQNKTKQTNTFPIILFERLVPFFGILLIKNDKFKTR